MIGPGFAEKVGEKAAGCLLVIALAIILVAVAVGFALGAPAAPQWQNIPIKGQCDVWVRRVPRGNNGFVLITVAKSHDGLPCAVSVVQR